MALAYPWHLVWFHDLYVKLGAFTRPEPIIPLGVLSVLIQGAVLSCFYPRFYRGGNPFVKGIQYSLALGLLVYTCMGFSTAAKFDINPVSTFLLYHTVFQTLQFVIFGVALGFIFRNTEPLDG